MTIQSEKNTTQAESTLRYNLDSGVPCGIRLRVLLLFPFLYLASSTFLPCFHYFFLVSSGLVSLKKKSLVPESLYLGVLLREFDLRESHKSSIDFLIVILCPVAIWAFIGSKRLSVDSFVLF